MSESPTITIAPARIPEDIEDVRALFKEYIESLGIDLTFQSVDSELAELPGKYAPPAGMILLARDSDHYPVGCIAVRPLGESGTCEMKRLYVRPQARGHQLGRRLAIGIMNFAQSAGYKRMVLDTLISLQSATKLYASLGFEEIAPYYDNPYSGVVYFGRDL